MKNKIFLFFSLLMLIFINSQNLHIKYTYLNPAHFIISEDLYVSGKDALSVRDSILSKNNNDQVKVDDSTIGVVGKITKQKAKYYKSFLENRILINEYIGDKEYWILDNPPKTVWNINYNDTKKIGKYICKKATAIFRGSKITAYYAPELAFAFGPYKFSGLPGVILEVGEDDNLVNFWKADLVELNVPEKIVLSAPNKNTISYKEFIQLQNDKDLEEVKRLTSQLPKGAIISIESPKRTAVEKKYEWED